jgi:MFS family permease
MNEQFAGQAEATGTRPGLNDMILFWASFFTLIAAGIGFSVRGDVIGSWAAQFGFTQTELGGITGGGLAGFGVSIIVLSFFADRIGYGRLMCLAWVLHASSAVVTLATTYAFDHWGGKNAAFWCLSIGMWLFSLGNGTCEAVINPLTATLFRKNKTHWLNILHAGWPGGLVLGAFIGLGFNTFGADLSWEFKYGVFLAPVLLYGVLMVGRRFPRSETTASGVSFGTMVVTLVSPILLFLFLLHAMIGYVELGTDNWIIDITKIVLKNADTALWAFIWTNVLMFCLRFFAGPIVHKISPLGLLFFSAIIGTAGLVLLGWAETNTVWLWLAAVTVYGIGKTFYWPTMLGVISERYPKAGALALGLSGGIGMLSAGFLGGPGIGYKQDYFAVKEIKDQKDSPGVYDRYKAQNEKKDASGHVEKGPDGKPIMVDDERAFLAFTGLFPPITGLDGAKVGVLLGDPGRDNGMGKKLEQDITNYTGKGNKLEDNENLSALNQWWQTEGKPHADKDTKPVNEARVDGGKMALLWTALVPAMMAVGFLLLILYFKAIGGYTATVLTGHAAEDEKFTGGTAGPGEG